MSANSWTPSIVSLGVSSVMAPAADQACSHVVQ